MRIKNYSAYNESYIDKESDLEELLSLKKILQELLNSLEKEFEDFIMNGEMPNEFEIQKRFKPYQILCALTQLSSKIAAITAQLFLFTGK